MEIVTIKELVLTKSMNSREIAELLGKRHDNIKRDIRTQLEQQQIDPLTFEYIYLDYYKRGQKEFKLDYEQTMILVSGYSVPLRAKIIKRWNELEELSKPALPSYAETLRLYASSIEENERLLLEKEEDKPKVEFYEAVTGSKNTIDMGTVAKVLNIKGWGRNRIFELLRSEKVLQKDNQPYQIYVDRGYFRLIESKFTKSDGSTHISIKTVMYQKGVDYIKTVIYNQISASSNSEQKELLI